MFLFFSMGCTVLPMNACDHRASMRCMTFISIMHVELFPMTFSHVGLYLGHDVHWELDKFIGRVLNFANITDYLHAYIRAKTFTGSIYNSLLSNISKWFQINIDTTRNSANSKIFSITSVRGVKVIYLNIYLWKETLTTWIFEVKIPAGLAEHTINLWWCHDVFILPIYAPIGYIHVEYNWFDNSWSSMVIFALLKTATQHWPSNWYNFRNDHGKVKGNCFFLSHLNSPYLDDLVLEHLLLVLGIP